MLLPIITACSGARCWAQCASQGSAGAAAIEHLKSWRITDIGADGKSLDVQDETESGLERPSKSIAVEDTDCQRKLRDFVQSDLVDLDVTQVDKGW